MKISYPFRRKLTHELPHFRVEEHIHKAIMAISKQYDVPTTELCRMAVGELVKKNWPKVQQ